MSAFIVGCADDAQVVSTQDDFQATGFEKIIEVTKQATITLPDHPRVRMPILVVAIADTTVAGGRHPIAGFPGGTVLLPETTSAFFYFDSLGKWVVADSAGPPGPPGPQGPQGPQGEQGPVGPGGPATLNVPFDPPLAVGDVVVSAANAVVTATVTRATPAALAAGPTVRGVVLAVNGDGTVTIPIPGTIIPYSITGLTPPTTPGWVVVDASARCQHVQVPTFGDHVVGADDAAGNLHFLPPPERSTVNETFVDAWYFGASGKITDDDQDVAIKAAIAYAELNEGPYTVLLRNVAGNAGSVYNISTPIRMRRDYSNLEGAVPDLITLRCRFSGPGVILGPRHDLVTDGGLTAALVPPAPGNPVGYGWDIDTDNATARCLPLWMSEAWNLDGKPAVALEFFYMQRSDLAANDVNAIGSCSGSLIGEVVGNGNDAWHFLITGVNYGAGQNGFVATLNLEDGPALLTGAPLTVGVVYHIALTYSAAEGTVRLFQTPVTTPTLIMTASSGGHAGSNVVQDPRQLATTGPSMNYIPSLMNIGGADGVIDAIRLSYAQRYVGGEPTPTTKWDRTTFDPDAWFILNFDEIYEDDVLVASTYQNSFKHYLALQGHDFIHVASSGQRVTNIKINSGLPSPASAAGIWLESAENSVLDNIGGANYLLYWSNGSLFGRRDRIRGSSGGPFGLVENSTATYLDDTVIQGGKASTYCFGSDGIRSISHAVSADVGGIGGAALSVTQAFLRITTFLADRESLTGKICGDLMAGQIARLDVDHSVFDGTYFAGGTTLSGRPPVWIKNAKWIRIRHSILLGSSITDAVEPVQEIVRIVNGETDTPVVLEECEFVDNAGGVSFFDDLPGLPLSLTPWKIALKSGEYSGQAGGARKWIAKDNHSIRQRNDYQASAFTTDANPVDVTFDWPTDTKVPLTDQADTRVDVFVQARGATWGWDQNLHVIFRRDGATITVFTPGAADPPADTLGVVPAAVAAAIVQSGASTFWTVTVTPPAVPEDVTWSMFATTREIAV